MTKSKIPIVFTNRTYEHSIRFELMNDLCIRIVKFIAF